MQAQTGRSWRVAPRAFYDQDTEAATRSLLGCLLVRVFASGRATDAPGAPGARFCGGRIVEAEAYVGEHDPAAHAARGRTPVTQILYGEPGHAYVFQIYGLHYCLNVVVKPAGEPGCVLIRAIEPLFGLEAMLERRKLEGAKIHEIGSGPGKVCQALGIDRRLGGADFTADPLLILSSDQPPPAIRRGPRIGVTKAADWPLRFWIDGSPWISRKCGMRNAE